MSNSELSPKHTDFDDEDVTFVITRTGRKELLDTNQITKRLQTLINRKPKIPHVNPYELMLEVCKGLKSSITTYEIDEYAANASASLSISNPHYLTIAARIAIDNHQKNTMRSFVDKMRKAYLNVDDDGKVSPLINEEFFKYVEEHQDFIESSIDYNRDFLFDFFGFRTFQKSYSIKIHDRPIERPQDMYMRTAIALNMNTESDIDVEHANIKETYDLLSNKLYTHASPTYYNAGGIHQQYASCFLLGTDDSLEGIEKTGTDMSRISKWAGGIGVHINDWRGTGAKIRGTNGKSSGIVPFLRTYDTRMLAFNQGGRRPGSAAIYLMPHHPDLLKFIALRRNDGLEKERARDLFYALWIPDIFMERVKDGALWSFFDSDRCGDLSNLWGDAYRTRYLELEEKKMYTSQLPAKEIWELVRECEQENGMPYICYSDNFNRANMHSHLGTVKSSNLCVSGDTLILTSGGYKPIKELAETEIPIHEIWNGFEFSKATFAKTGIAKKLLKITFSDGVELKCTPEHKFALWNGYGKPGQYIEATASVLSVGDKLLKHDFPVIETGTASFRYPYTHGFYCGDGTNEHKVPDTTHCTHPAVRGGSYCGRHRSMGLPVVPRLASGRCAAKLRTITKYADLYHEKKELLPYMEYVSSTENTDVNRTRLTLHDDIADKFVIPSDGDLNTRLQWLAGYLDADGTIAKNGDVWSIQVTSIEKDFLMKVKLLCNTLGVNPMMHMARRAGRSLLPDGHGGHKYYPTKAQYRLCFSVEDSSKLFELDLPTHRLQWNNKVLPMRSKKQYISITAIEPVETSEDTYCFNEPLLHMGIFNGVLTMNCGEIALVSNNKEYAVCVLSSISLPAFVVDGYTSEELAQPEASRRQLNHAFPLNPNFDFRKLLDVVKVVVRNLNHVVNKTYHPVPEARRGSDRHRPIGVGVQGLDDAYAKMRFAFDSPEAFALNKQIFEAIYFAALTTSTTLCRKKWKASRAECKAKGSITVTSYKPDTYDTYTTTYIDPDSIPKRLHAFPSIEWNGGSPIGKGHFHWEWYGLKTENLSGMFDWESLRCHIMEFGVMNSHLVALMPTASTSQLLGNNECLSGDTPVMMGDGLYTPIEKIKVGTAVVSYSEKQGGLVKSTVYQTLNKGLKKVVKLTFIDGRTVVCTPEHKFMLENGQWCKASDIPILGTAVKMGLTGTEDIVGDDEKDWYLETKTGVFDMSTPENREKSLIFARMLGFIRADGSIQPGKVTAVFGVDIDKDTFIEDFKKLDPTPNNVKCRVNEKKCHEVIMNGPISIAMRHLPGMANGSRVVTTPSWPEFILDPACPKAILREFLAGLFGGDGWAPVLVKNKDQTATFSPIRFSQTSCAVNAEHLQNNMQQLCDLLDRCGVPGATIINQRMIKCKTGTYRCGESEHICIRIGLPLNAMNQHTFMDKIGIRYCSHKSYRCEVAAMWARYLNAIKRQRVQIISKALESNGNTVQQNLDAAVEELEGTEPILNDFYSKPSITQVYDYKRKASSDIQFKFKHVLTAQQFLEEIGAIAMFNNITGESGHTYATQADAVVLPTIKLQLLDIRDAGERNVYDINITNTHTFLANGVVVHNCFEPYTSNVYKRDTSAGEYIVIKKHLMNDLYNLGLWNKDLKDYIIASEGSIQNIDGIPDDLKRLYKTAWEIDQSVLVQQSIDRQPFVDQAQSLNLYIRDFNLTKWNKLMFQGWRGKLKTGKYYLHTEAAVMPTKFTIDPAKQAEMQVLLEKNTVRSSFLEPLRDVCDACSS
jgi:ribonucleoside-diphosphate reductase alpha chain